MMPEFNLAALSYACWLVWLEYNRATVNVLTILTTMRSHNVCFNVVFLPQSDDMPSSYPGYWDRALNKIIS